MTPPITRELQAIVLEATHAESMREIGVVKSLWSSYGSIVRYALQGGSIASVIVKRVRLAPQGRHPRGWNTDLSHHQRKLRSYRVGLVQPLERTL